MQDVETTVHWMYSLLTLPESIRQAVLLNLVPDGVSVLSANEGTRYEAT